MAARRLLIVMLVLLGLSTLAAALVPQRTINEGSTTGTTKTQTTTTTSSTTIATVPPQIPIKVGPKRLPLVRAHVGDQFTLLVTSVHPKEISIPEFGLLGFASANTPARFELLTPTRGTFGILFTASGKVAAKLEVTTIAPPKNKGQRKGAKGQKKAQPPKAKKKEKS
jgi:hypothetical protein